MKFHTKLLILAAFFVLALPMAFMVGTAQAAAPFLLDDGAGLKDNGQWEVIDTGSCQSNAAQTTRAACTAEKFPAFTDRASCEGTAYCTNPTYTTAADCIGNGYAWTFTRAWNVSECIGIYSSNRTYGPTASACSNPIYRTATDCTVTGAPATWDAYNNNVTDLNESSRQQCLHCHNDAYGTHSLASFGNGSTQDTYFRTGHRNVLRRVTDKSDLSGKIPLGGPNYTYDPSAAGVAPYTNVNWATGAVGTQQGYYIYNNWFSSIKVNQIEGDPTPDSATASTVTNYSGARSCFFCHTSAYNLPEARYPLASETFQASVTSTAALAKFEIGITCVTCHKGAGNLWADYGLEHHTATSTNDFGNFPQYEEGTALCSTCHRYEDTAGPITDVAIQDDALLIEELADHHGNITGQFLQSPHAKFTGTFGEIQDPSKYASNFKLDGAGCTEPEYHTQTTCTTNGGTWAATGVQHNMGCQECHNPHVSSVDPDTRDTTNSLTQMVNFCVDCHSNAADTLGSPQINIAMLDHPAGPGTPVNNGSLANEKVVNMACIRCHMSNRINHLFKVNTDVNYSTFPSLCSDTQYETRTTCTKAGGTWSNMSVEWGGHALPAASGFVELDVNFACLWCHNGTDGPIGNKAWAAGEAKNIHRNTPTANFSTSIGNVSYKINFNASSSTCPTGSTCTYDWDFTNDGATDATGITASFTFAGTGPYPVTLKVTASGNSASITKDVSPKAVNAPPTVCSNTWTFSGRTVSFTDCSTDPEGSATVYVNWGDGKPVEAFSMSSGPSHTYAFNGTYNITHWVQDSKGLKSTEMKSVTVPAKYKVTVITSPATSGALVRVKLAGVLKSQGYTKSTAPVGTFTSVGLDPNIYDVTISKAGSTFTCNFATADLTAGNATIACTVTTP